MSEHDSPSVDASHPLMLWASSDKHFGANHLCVLPAQVGTYMLRVGLGLSLVVLSPSFKPLASPVPHHQPLSLLPLNRQQGYCGREPETDPWLDMDPDPSLLHLHAHVGG